MKPILQNIKKIQVIEARLLQNLTIIPGTGVMMNYWRNFTDLPLANLASMETVSKIDNKSRLFTTSIKALMTKHFEVDNRRLAFMVTTVSGDRFLVGTHESPFPITNTSDVFPDKETEVSGCTLSVEYTDTLGLLPVLDSF